MKNLIQIVRYPGPVKEAPAKVTITFSEGKKIIGKLFIDEGMNKNEIILALLETAGNMLVAK